MEPTSCRNPWPWQISGSLKTRFCRVGVKIDNDQQTNSRCQIRNNAVDQSGTGCNGKPDFCRIPIDRFLFPGSHNAGTGTGSGAIFLPQVFQNQDLNIAEQLDFGLRFFDFDVIFRFGRIFFTPQSAVSRNLRLEEPMRLCCFGIGAPSPKSGQGIHCRDRLVK